MYLRILNKITIRRSLSVPHTCLLSILSPNKMNLPRMNDDKFVLNQTKRLLRGGDGYSEFGHGRFQGHPLSKYGLFYARLICIILPTLTLLYVMYGENIDTSGKQKSSENARTPGYNSKIVRAASIELDDNQASENNEEFAIDKKRKSKKSKQISTGEDEKESNKKRITFKDRKIIAYENRIREYSTPDKIFRYFATLKVYNEDTDDYDVYMTPDDFVRSLTYGAKQPDDLGLDSYQRYDPQVYQLNFNLKDDNVFCRLGQNGLISFSDYLFLITLLSTPTRHFEIAFKMFDLDGNGNIDYEEFEQLHSIIRNNTQMGKKHRDTHMTGNVLKENSALINYFFGNDKKELLTVDKFIAFQKNLQQEMMKIEFERNEPVNGKISDMNFCEMLLAYAGFNETKTKKLLKRMTKSFKDPSHEGISFKDYEDFFHVLRSIQDIDTALKFYSLAGASIDKTILKHVAKTVANVSLSDHVIDVVFVIFDENGDNKLSHQEFVQVMKKRWLRGLQNPKDTGFVRFLNSFVHCTKETIRDFYF